MNFFDHTIAWIKGELFEASLILSFGLLTILGGYLFWKTGATPNAKALLFPLVVTGLVYASIGGAMLYSNQKRLPVYKQSYGNDKTSFVLAEKKRVEGFQYGYTISKIVASVCFPLTLLIFWWTKNPTWMGWGIGLTLFAFSGLVVDYFSQERAGIYYREIAKELLQI